MDAVYEIVFVLMVFAAWCILLRPALLFTVHRSVALVKRNDGVTMVEYAILLALIAIAVATGFPSITTAIRSVFQNASSVMVAKP